MNHGKLKLLGVIGALLLGAGFFIFMRFGVNLFTVGVDSFKSIVANGDIETYSNNKFKFSFNYPKGFRVSSFSENDGSETILIKNAAADNGFQIHISPFDEPGPVTKERILKDLPDMIINNDSYIAIGGNQALSFEGQDELGKKTIEIWLINGGPPAGEAGYLYQVMGYEDFREEMMGILSSWNFSN